MLPGGLKNFVVLLYFLLSSRNINMVTVGLYNPHTMNLFLKYFHLFQKGFMKILKACHWNHWLIEGKGQWSPKPQIIAVTAAYVAAMALAQFPKKRKEKKIK